MTQMMDQDLKFPHQEPHPQAGQFVKIVAGEFAGETLHLEDWQDRVAKGMSWMFMDGHPASMMYAMRAGMAGLPMDNEVVYGHIGGLGHMLHVSELEE